MTPHEFIPTPGGHTCQSCGMAPVERNFLAAHPSEELRDERHIDTPDELLDLMASISSDPQVEGLSLAQKAQTIALLHIAKALQQIAEDACICIALSDRKKTDQV